MPDLRILIVSTEPLIAALLAAWVELDGAVPLFLRPGEHVLGGIERGHPHLLLVDIGHADGAAPASLARARLAGIGVVLFSPDRRAIEVETVARKRGVPWFTLPMAREQFSSVLRTAVEASRRDGA